MKLAKLSFVVIVTMLLATTVLAQCPMPGTYYPMCGRASEAFCTGVGNGQAGNTINAMSWDGTNLGTQWRVWGQAILDEAPDGGANPAMTEAIDPVTGNGTRTYYTYYGPGNLWIAADGPGAYEGELNAVTDFFYVVQTRTVMNWVEVGATSNITIDGEFENCPGDCVVNFAISNATLMGAGTGPAAGYPDYLCGADVGSWFDVCGTIMQFSCAVATDQTTWGSLKGLYR